MKFAHLVWRNMMRRRLRTLFTLLSIVVAFVLYGFLAAVRLSFGMGVDVAGADRLIVIHKVSIIQPLPESYQARLDATPGVVLASYQTWFGGIYQDPKNFFAQMAVDPDRFLAMYPEFVIPADQKKAWRDDRTGALVGRSLATRFGWKIGDRVPIQPTVWRTKNGGNLEFTVRAIYDGNRDGVDTSQFIFHYKYLDETRAFGEGLVGWYVIRIDHPDKAAEIGRHIDDGFANSEFETKTTTEKAFAQSFAAQVGNIGAIVTAITAAVFFTILLVAGNTMAQGVRERLNELAVMKTLGYSDGRVLALVLAESCLLAGVGGGLGLLLAWLFTRAGDPTGGFLAAFYIPVQDFVTGATLIAALGIGTGLLPALRAMRLPIVQAMRGA